MKDPAKVRDAATVLLEELTAQLHEVEDKRAQLNGGIASVRRLYAAAVEELRRDEGPAEL